MRNNFSTVLKSLAVMAALCGSCLTASAVEPVTEGFDGFKAGWNSGWTAWELTLPEGWDYSGQSNYFSAGGTYKTAAPSIEVSETNTSTYLITPMLSGDFSFYIRNYTKNYQASITAYACTYADGQLTLGTVLGSQTLDKSSGTPAWQLLTYTASTATRVALLISKAYFDDFTYTPADGGGSGEGGDDPEPEPDPAPVMVVSTTTVNFGKVVANATYDFTVSNTGNAELTATIASDNEDFTVSKTNVTVAAGAAETVTITYLYKADAYGSHTATITLTPNAGEAATIAVSAYVQNPNVWTEDFSANALPNGWEAGSCWTFSDGVAHGQYVHNANDYLTTPALVVEGVADQLTFQARQAGIYPDIIIQKSLNGGEWTELRKIKSDDLPETWTTFTIDGLAAGSYQFRFLSDSYDLDNFEGFRLNQDAPVLTVTPTTDAAFGKVTAQPEALTYGISNTGTGTLTGTITSSDATLFTVSKSDFTLAAGESTMFDVALVYNEQYGPRTATITIHPANEGLADVVINATATLVDPNFWTEDFNEGTMPEGWNTTGWAVGISTAFDNSTPMALAPQSTTAASLTTPRLNAKAGNVLTWDAYLRWKDEPLLVEYTVDDQGTWTTVYNYKAEDEGQDDKYVKQMSFTAPAEGTYRLRFTSKMQNGLDNFSGFMLAPSTATKENWWVSYTFHYKDENGEDAATSDVEPMEVEFDGDNVAFNFPNPITGNARMEGSKYVYDGPTAYIFPNGQYIGKYGTESAYFCGSNGSALIDMLFYYDEEKHVFSDFEHILINSSPTAVSYWGYFSDVIVSKEKPLPTGIADVRGQKEVQRGDIYDLQGRKVANGSLPRGLYIVNGKKVIIK